MQAGLLTDIVTFLRSESTRDVMGGTCERWVKAFDKRARVQFKSGARKEVNSEVLNTSVITITIRYCKEISEKMRISYEGREYTISSINRDRKQQATVIEAEVIHE